MKIIIPMAGVDQRFEKIGVFKPLIMIKNKPLIYHVLSHNPFPLDNLFFITLLKHEKKYSVSKKLKNYFGSNISVSVIDKPTQGSPNTILEISNLINYPEDILIELGDVVRKENDLTSRIENSNAEGIIPVDEGFKAPVWGYVRRRNYRVLSLEEKIDKPIMGGATMGLYYFKSGDKFIQYSKKMIKKKKTIGKAKSYFIGPVYNEYIEDNMKIEIANAKILAILGSPNQIENYKKSL